MFWPAALALRVRDFAWQHVVRARGFVERCGFLTSFILMNGTLDASGTCFAVCRSTLDSRAQAHLRLHIRKILTSIPFKSCTLPLAQPCRPRWTLLLLLILFYTFSCIFAQLVTDHCRFATIDLTGDPNAVPVCPVLLEQYWGNVMDSMMTLFMSITGGINWLDAYAPLREVSPIALGLMNLYIVIGFFTILNVVTGVFVNTAIESAGADKDLATLKQLQKKVENMSALQEVFQ
ncbi:unnamed protein product, partial [Cladocopium goreaui]